MSFREYLLEAKEEDEDLTKGYEKVYSNAQFNDVPKKLKDFMIDVDYFGNRVVYGYSPFRTEDVRDIDDVDSIVHLPKQEIMHIILMKQWNVECSFHPSHRSGNSEQRELNDYDHEPYSDFSRSDLTKKIDIYIAENGGYKAGWAILLVWGRRGNQPSFKTAKLPAPSSKLRSRDPESKTRK